MAWITLPEAATRLRTAPETIVEWVERGLLVGQPHVRPAPLPSGQTGPGEVELCVDEDQLADVAESLGWLELSREGWDEDD
jgi:hypothetical protein